MKKMMIITMFITIACFTGCGMNEETSNVEIENDSFEEIEVEEILHEEIISEEYLEELEYNSRENVFFEER